ncbi:hypothetical protein [Patulibacter americanus]|uniref:hypothetical protein n=1 Tax=Patulibacter americanus TaxID=588672 RepID=UPI0003B71FD9|nr:hypothetical protein [Patulibacter americanus]
MPTDSTTQPLPAGLRHWTARHPGIGMAVSSYALVESGVLLNPLLPQDDAVLSDVEPTAIVLTNRHHLRSAGDIGGGRLPVHVPQAGMWDLEGVDLDLRPYADGDELPGGLRAVEIGALSPDEFAVHHPGLRALAVADGVMRDGDGPLATFPDHLLGDDPDGVRRGLGQAFARACDELEFDHLLLAHGEPVVGTGREDLRRFALRLAGS